MDLGQILNVLLYQPITNLLFLSYHLLVLVGIPYALGFSIIVLTVLIRLVILPFTASQIKMRKKMQEMAPHLSLLKEKHKDDKKRQQEETMKLYKEFGVNPAAGCLPVLIQMPVIFTLYRVLNNVVHQITPSTLKEINHLLYFDWIKVSRVWDVNFFGIPLAAIPSKDMKTMPFLIAVPIITGVLQLVLTKMMAPEVAVKQTKEDDFQASFAKQSLFIFPVMIGFFSYTLPFGLSLYWNVFSIFGILQQYFLVGPGGLKQWLAIVKNNDGKRK